MKEQTVVGQNDHNVDVPALQKAVDQGGTVLLRGVFDFGQKGNVTIARDVRIVGEVDGGGVLRTTIKGGGSTLRSLRPAAAGTPGPKITIQQIHFDGATWMPIYIGWSSGAAIVGNHITRVRPAPHGIVGQPPYDFQHGIVVGGITSELGKFEPYQENAIAGTLNIADNEIDLSSDSPKTTLGIGIWIIRTTGITANISRNTVRNASRNSIEAIDNFRASDGTGRIVIQDNDIETAIDGIPIPTPQTPNGIVAGYFFDKAGAIDAKRAVQLLIVHNAIRARGQSSMGIALITDAAFVRGNQIRLQGEKALGVFVGGSRNYIGHNRFEGSGMATVFLAPFVESTQSENELDRNELSGWAAVQVDVVFSKGANYNIVAGSGTISDLGSGNRIEGLKPLAVASSK